jgi:regulator of sigma D
MLWKFKNNLSKIEHAITEWLKERQELLVLFYKINGMQPFADDCLETEEEVFKRFSQLLIDYLSCGHLEVFQQLSEENEKLNSHNSKLDRAVITQIYTNTKDIMQLMVNENGKTTNLKTLKNNLDQLGQQIALRVELEDKLVNKYIVGKSAQESISAPNNQRPSR